MNMNFIRYTLISKILTKYRQKRDFYVNEGFFYFDNKVRNIDRIGRGFLFNKDEIIQVDWHDIDSRDLLDIFRQLKNNEFYFYREIEGKILKFRPKKKNVKSKV